MATRDKILLVEGRDDKHVVLALLKQHDLEGLCEIIEADSVEKLLEAYPVRLKQSDLSRFGAIVDANTSLQSRWDSLRNSLDTAGYTGVPVTPATGGTLLPAPRPGLPQVGVWIMPDNKLPGILEDFVSLLVPPADGLMQRVHENVAAIPQAERKFKDKDLPKVYIHTWLAWQKDPGMPLGKAVTAKFLDPHAAGAGPFVAWLRNVFT